ncbi:MAG: hypothetical protein HN666_01070, partial [Candidatus Peribacter sp.]|nr:hypothetical protein [Candidatus Peribacter sp.]
RKTWSRWWHPLDPYGPLRVRRRILKQLGVAPKFQKSWLDLAIHLFDLGKETNQSVFHLWGHSHEIEKYGMWEDLEKFLAHVQKSNVECVVNSKAI